jgi:hypothetical protein
MSRLNPAWKQEETPGLTAFIVLTLSLEQCKNSTTFLTSTSARARLVI